MKLQIKSKAVSIHGKTDVLDENENVLYRIHGKAVSIHDKTYIEDASGNEVAYVHAKAVSIHHTYYVEMANGESFELKEELLHMKDIIDIEPVGWQLRGNNVLDFDFQITDANGRVLAIAHRKFASVHGIYNMDIVDEGDADRIVAIFIIVKHIVEQRGESTAMSSSASFNSGN